jgi:hypothetical protein
MSNEILDAILKAIETVCKDVKSKIDLLPFIKKTGNYLKQEVIERRLFRSGFETDVELREYIKSYLDVHQARGTEAGLVAELERITRNEVFVREARSAFSIDFSIVFEYDVASPDQYVLDTDLQDNYSGGLSGGVFCFAVDRRRKYYFVTESNVLKRRSLLDGSLEATEYASAGAQKPLFVDPDGFLWTIDNTPNKYIRKWAPDLQSRTDYTLKTENPLDDKISFAAMTFDGNYLYVMGGTDYKKFAKYYVSDLDGDAIWFKSAHYGAFSGISAVDEQGNVFISGYWGTGYAIKKYLSDGSDGWAASPYVWREGYKYFAYCQENGMLYVPKKYLSNKFLQYRASDGQLVATTASCGAFAYCCAVLDDGNLLCGTYTGGGTNTAIKRYLINDNWQDGSETYVEQRQIGSSKEHIFCGDPTGYINKCMTEDIEDSESGWWLDFTYPEIGHGCYYDESTVGGRLDCENVAIIQYSNWNPHYFHSLVREIIQKHFVPVHIDYVLEECLDAESMPLLYNEIDFF